MSVPQREDERPPRERLAETEERFRMLADNMSQLAWTCDLLGNVTWYNKRWLDYTGLTFEDMKGWDWTKVQHPDHVDRVVARVRRSGETGEPWEDTFPLRGKDGHYRWFLSRALPIRDEQGNLIHWFGTNTDVTEQKLAEEQVARQAQELRALNERLRESDRLKTEFFSNVSHEFRTPLTLMLGPVEDILAKPEDRLLVESRELLSVVHRNGLRLLRLVNTLLDFSRVEAGRVEAVYEAVDLAALTADLSSVFRSAVERAGLKLIVDCPALAETVYVDREMWEKIVLNLLSNAFKFTFEGAITVALRPTGDTVELQVRDTGAGIAAQELSRIFERFYRVQGARGRTHEGSGIGLALVQELVKLHGGTVGVTSELGRGTIFTVAIPLGCTHLPSDRIGATRTLTSTAPGAASYVEEALRWLPDADSFPFGPPGLELEVDRALTNPLHAFPSKGESNARRARILWADDNADMRDYVRRLLGGHYEVEAVTDGRAALAVACAHPPDLILADVMMPQLDGFELLRELRARPETRTLPVILLSARAGEESRVQGLEAGADDYLVKPFSARELLARVAARLEIARLWRQSESTIRALKDDLQVQMQDLERLHEVTVRLARTELPMLLEDVLDAALTITGADMGNIQLTDKASGLLRIVVQRGFEHPFLDYFDRVPESQAACGTAMADGERVIVENVVQSPIFENTPTLAVMLAAGARAVQSTPLIGRSGRVLGMLSTHYRQPHRPNQRELRLLDLLARPAADLIEKAQADGALRESETRFRMMANVTPSIVWTAAPDGTITFASDRWFEYTGIARDENPRHWPQVLHPEDVARCTAAWTKALEEGTEYAIEVRNRSRDGEYRWFLTRATPVRDAAGRIELWFGSTTDIHDSKAAELERERLLAEHQQQREFLESLIANAPVAIAVVQGTDLRYTLVNPTYQAIVGPDIPLLGRTYRDLFPEAADRGAEEGLRQVLRTGQRWSVRDFETPIPGRDGMTWWDSEVLTVPGVPDSLLILTWEITDRKRAEEALRRAKGASEAANRAKDEFLATLGHELRNPLGAIAGAVSVLSLGVKTDNETAEPREIIGRQTAHLSRLLDDLLDLTRLDTGKIVLQRRPLNLKALTERALGSLAEGGKAAQHAIAITGTGETLWVEGDPTRLEQVIFNLLDNAVKYTPPGGRITLTVNSEGAAAVVRVADTGIGMTPDALARVFEPFFQAESPHARPGGGLGLGLTLVKRLVELHGGDIAADSPGLGHGTQVRVRLPLTDAPGGPEAAPPSEAVAEPRRVLVIDDNSDMRTTLRMLLKLGGHHVDEAADGVQGLELLLRLRPDVAFIDLGLPGRDGYEVARAIRRAPGGQSLYLVALTGYGQPQDRQRGLEAGFNAYLVKPVYQSDLVRVLAAAADG